ncbi:MAG: bifunctional acetate--CoA ligase family protein/GNAT family N-acetyltransferase [Burkholderiaceae bacterium]
MENRHYLSPLFDPDAVALIVAPGEQPPWIDGLRKQLAQARARTAVFECRGEWPARAEAERDRERFDLAVIAMGRRSPGDALELAIGLGVRAVTILCDRLGGDEAALLAARARAARVRLLGPATMGFARPHRRLNASRMGPLPPPGNVALVSQSGALNGAVLDWAGDTAIGFSMAVSLGAEADVDLAQVLDFLAADRSTKAVVVYLEAVRDSRSFMSALRALATIKPVVVLKGGRGTAAPRAARTHSGALIVNDQIYAAALRRAGAVQVRLFTQLFTAVRYLASRNWPIGRRLAMVSNGHGPMVLAADQAMYQQIALPPFSAASQTLMRERLSAPVEPANPLDLGTSAGAEDFGAAIEILSRDGESDALLVLMTPYAGVPALEINERVAALAPALNKPLFACWLGDSSVRPLRARLDGVGVPVYRTPEAAVDAFSTVSSFYHNQLLLQQAPRPLSEMEPPDVAGARALLDRVQADGRDTLTELESKNLLDLFHVPVSPTVLATSAADAALVAEQIGFPVALKIGSADILHKSDVGGVVLNVRNTSEIHEQFDAIVAAVRSAQPEARIDGVTVQPMKGGRHSRELYVGVFRDPRFGPVIAFGAGGLRIDVLRDTTLEFPPLNDVLARSMIARTRVAGTLGEFRGAPAADLEALARLLVRVSEMVCELPQIAELDINPVIIDAGGLSAVDARVVLGPAADGGGRYGHLAIMPYPSHMVQQQALSDGRWCTVRPIQAEDADALQRFTRSLSDQSRYFRFFSSLNELPQRLLVRYTQIDYDRELALVATVLDDAVEVAAEAPPARGGDPGRETIIGVVRYLLNPDRRTCEFAIAIGDRFQGKGLGTMLMRAIIDAARVKGLTRIEGNVLTINTPMIRLMRSLGFGIEADPEDAAVKYVWRDLLPDE